MYAMFFCILMLPGPPGFYCWAIYCDFGHLCHVIIVYMLPVLCRPAVSYLRVCSDIAVLPVLTIVFLLFHNYVILYLFSGGGDFLGWRVSS